MKILKPEVIDGKNIPSLFLKRETIYLPFYIYRAKYTGGREIYMMIDGIKGKSVKIDEKILKKPVDSTGKFEASISKEKADEIALQEMRFPIGIFFKKRLESLKFIDKLLYPFLVYYRKKGDGFDIELFDGLTGKKENLFAKEMVISIIVKSGKSK